MLLKRDYVYQEPDENDRRRMLLHLTEEGVEVEKVVTRRVETRFQGWVEVFGQTTAQNILEFIRTFDDKVVSKTKARSRGKNDLSR